MTFVIYFKIIFIVIYLHYISPSKSLYSDFSDWSSISGFLIFFVISFSTQISNPYLRNFAIMSAF